jgi:hypothetical protein
MLIADKYNVAWIQQIIKISIIKALKGRPSVKGKYNVEEKMLTGSYVYCDRKMPPKVSHRRA